MTFLKLPLILAAVMMLRRVDAGCVEDNCYGALYWNPAGAEECSDHFVTTVIPSPTTTTVTIASAVTDITTITGPSIGINTAIPSFPIPTYIVRACYGDVSYRFESACSCIEAGPTTITAQVPTVTNTVLVPLTSGSVLSPLSPLSPEITPTLPTTVQLPVIGNPTTSSAAYSCIPIAGPVIVTIHVDETFATIFTLFGSILCLGETSNPPAQSSGCNCASSLPSAPFSPSFTGFTNVTSYTSGTGSFSTIVRTSFSGLFNTSSTAATPEPSTSEEPTSIPAPTSLEPSSVESSQGPSSTTVGTSTTTGSSQGPSSRTSSSALSGPTSFIPQGRNIILQIASPASLLGQYIETDPPGDGALATNLKSHTTPEFANASVWTLDAATGILFQEIAGEWWGAWFGLGLRKQWDSIKLLPADTVVSWLVTPAIQKSPLRCVIDFSASDVFTCGAAQWTVLMQSDKCGWAITTPYNPSYAAACPNSEELFLQAIEVNPVPEGNSK